MRVGDAAIKIADALAESCKKIGAPLEDDQRTIIVGGLAVWLDWWTLNRDRPSETPANEKHCPSCGGTIFDPDCASCVAVHRMHCKPAPPGEARETLLTKEKT